MPLYSENAINNIFYLHNTLKHYVIQTYVKYRTNTKLML